jgi:hypothetical protein
MSDITAALDQNLMKLITRKFNLSISSAPTPAHWEDAKAQLKLAQRHGGFGLTPSALVAQVAYISSLAATIEYTSRKAIPLHSLSSLATRQLGKALINELNFALPVARENINEEKVLDSLPKRVEEFQRFFRPAPLSNDRTIPRTAHLQHVLTTAKQKTVASNFILNRYRRSSFHRPNERR